MMDYQPSYALTGQKLQWICFDYKWVTHSQTILGLVNRNGEMTAIAS